MIPETYAGARGGTPGALGLALPLDIWASVRSMCMEMFLAPFWMAPPLSVPSVSCVGLWDLGQLSLNNALHSVPWHRGLLLYTHPNPQA